MDEKIPSLSLPTLAMMFRVRFRQNASMKLIDVFLGVCEKKIVEFIWMTIFSFFHATNAIPKMWTDPNLTEDMKDVEFASMIAGYDHLMGPLSKLFKDPLNQGFKIL